jgi:alpha-tubulin suppressor-like RCC1 family protein
VQVTQLAMKHQHVCALTAAGAVRCWGDGQYGELGYGLSHLIGDDEPASTGGDVDVGEAAEQVVVGESHTCVLLTGGRVKCWGQAYTGQLGYGNVVDIGDDELPSSIGVVDVGGEVKRLVTARYHTCAILVGGGLRCWGANDVGLGGRGIPDECATRALDQYICFRWSTCCVGDNEAPSSVGEVEL